MNAGEDDVRRNAKSNELKIKGIPHVNGENLKDIFAAIAKFIGYDLTNTNNQPELHRMQTRNASLNEFIPLPTIIVKFVAKHFRDNFYSLHLAKVSTHPLMTENINLAQGGRVIISENLTSVNQQLQ